MLTIYGFGKDKKDMASLSIEQHNSFHLEIFQARLNPYIKQ
jgi:hypothetical protein